MIQRSSEQPTSRANRICEPSGEYCGPPSALVAPKVKRKRCIGCGECVPHCSADAIYLTDEDDLVLMTENGMVVRIAAKTISVIGRATQGVTLIRLGENEQLVQIEPVAASVDGDDDGDAGED